MQTLWQDLRYGARMLMKQSGFTLIAVLTLALGIGATTAIFSVINGVLLRPLPYAAPERLVSLWESGGKSKCGRCPVSALNAEDWRRQAQSFEALTLYQRASAALSGEGESERINGARVAADFFNVLGMPPRLGRYFNTDEGQAGGPRTVVISYALWMRRFGGTPDVIGKTIQLEEVPYQVIGVAPSGIDIPLEQTEYWTSGGFRQGARGMRMISGVLARLKPNVTLAQARTEMKLMSENMARAYPDANADWTIGLMSLREERVGDVTTPLWLMLGAVGFVLLIACANVASMLLARAATRQSEFALRSALGGGRARLLRQLLLEGVPLALLGGALGVLFAFWGVDALLALSPANLPRLKQVRVDWLVLGFTLVVSLLTGVLFSLAPAWQLLRAGLPELMVAMKNGAQTAASGGRHRWPLRNLPLRNLLVVAEVALALVLLIGAGLMARSLHRLQTQDLGFTPDQTLTVNVNLSPRRYDKDETKSAFFTQLLTSVQNLPGVEQAALSSTAPLGGAQMMNPLALVGRSDVGFDKNQMTMVDVASPGFFATYGIPLRGGRFFNEQDRQATQPVVIINQYLAQRFWPGQNPVGQRVLLGGDEKVSYEVVGVVGDIQKFAVTPGQTSRLADPSMLSQMYKPFSQDVLSGAVLGVRGKAGTLDRAALSGALKALIWQQDKTIPLTVFRTTEEIVARSAATQRFYALLFGVFALVALLMALAGIYGVLSFTVAQRTREIGIRMALGAQARDVQRLIVRHGLWLSVSGLLIGGLAAFGLTRLLKSMLYETSATDPRTYIAVAGVLLLISLAACWIPARRATKVDPMIALRCE